MSAYNGTALLAGDRRRRRWLILAAVVAIGALVGAFFLGRAAGSAKKGASAPGLAVTSGQGALDGAYGPARMDQGLPVGYSRDRGGALQAAAVMSETLIDAVQSRRTVTVGQWVATYGDSTQLSDGALQVIYNTTATKRPGSFPATGAVPGLSTTSSTVRAVQQITPIGYKLNSISPNAADVEAWLAGEGWQDGSAWANLVFYQDYRLRLAWVRGDWHLSALSWAKFGGPAGTADPAQFHQMPGYQPWLGGTQITVLTGQ